jgi:hypothetical protein
LGGRGRAISTQLPGRRERCIPSRSCLYNFEVFIYSLERVEIQHFLFPSSSSCKLQFGLHVDTHTQRSLANCWTHTHTTHASMQSSRWDGEGDGEEGWTMQWYSGIQVKLRPFRLHLLLAASTSSSPVSSLHTLKYFLISTKCIIQERRSASSFPRHRVSIRY